MSRAPQDIILTPVITEKSAGIIEDGKYTFKVAVDANKTEIKLAVEKLFGVKVTGVNITNYDGKVKRLAMKSALSSKVIDKKLIVVDEINLSEIKTAVMAKALKDLKAESALVVFEDKNKNAELSVRNIPNVKSALVNTINVFDILKYDSFLVTKAAVEKIQEVYV